MLDAIVNNTKNYTELHDKENRKDKGQFFTSLSIAKFMAMKASFSSEHISVLEPGAGNGLLTAAVVEYCVKNELCDSFYVKFIENDPEIHPVLNHTASLIRRFVIEHHGNIEISISANNYITESEDDLYDIVICNPPYKKIRKDSAESVIMSDYIYGQPNLYGLFMCRGLMNLRKGGRFVFITPRSWVSGSYYKLVRRYILANLNLSDLLLFESRDGVFQNEEVLQETVITSGIKGEKQSQYISLYNADDTDMIAPVQMEVPASLIKGIGEDEYLLLPTNDDDLQTLTQMSCIKDTFESLGYCFKTGPVVEFRNKDVISSVEKDGYIPMFRSANIVNGQCVFPADTNKAQYVDSAERKLLLSNQNTVFLRRLSAKEEPRRLQSCVYYQTGENEYISVENHVNYLTHTDNSPLSVEEVEWINRLLMSEDYDAYYRMLNGSTQVNAGEINRLPLQRRI